MGMGRRVAVPLAVLLFHGACSHSSAPSHTETIGPEGGELRLQIADGEFTITLPAGALARSTSLTAQERTTSTPGAASHVVDLGPDGETFAVPAKLSLRLPGGSPLAGLIGRRLTWARLEASGRWTPLPTQIRRDGSFELTAETSHFSSYAVITECRANGTGTSFSVACPAFNDVTISTSAPVTLDARSGSVALIMVLEPTGGPVQFDIAGLTAGHTYSLYVDTFSAGVSMTADSAGRVSFAQDLVHGRVVILQNHPASVSLDALSCPSYGTFDSPTATCTLTTDIPDSVSIDAQPFTLDCAGHSLGSTTTTSSIGLLVSGQSDVTVRNCHILSAQTAYQAQFCARNVIEAITATPAGSSADTALFLYQVDGATLDSFSADGFVEGINFVNGTTVSAKNVALKPTFIGIEVTGSCTASIENLKVDSSSTSPARVPFAGLDALAGSDVTIAGFDGSHLGGFSFGLEVDAFGGDSSLAVTSATVSEADVGVGLFGGVAPSSLSDSIISDNGTGVSTDGHPVVFHNNIFGNTQRQVSATTSLELSSGAQGNFWGHSCPTALFAPGVDSNSPGVVDSFPFGQPTAWKGGDAPGCTLSAPIVTAPISGTVTNDSRPTIQGLAASGAQVSLRADTIAVGAGFADAGTFALRPTFSLNDGPHDFTVVASIGGQTSPESAPVHIVIDTIAPAAPQITVPSNGFMTFDSTISIAGTAEANAQVTIYEGPSPLATVLADATGAFSAQPANPFSTGTHSVIARAADGAGNFSPPSPSISFTVAAVSTANPIMGTKGTLAIRSMTATPNPFSPPTQSNTLSVSGDVSRVQGNHTYTVAVQRVVQSATTSQTLATVTSSTPLPPNLSFSAQNTWDGRDSTGQLVPAGTYIVTTQVAVMRVVPGNPGNPPDCRNPFTTTSGPCVVDFSPPASTTLTVLPPQVLEACDGVDNDGDGIVDEGCGVGCMVWSSEARREACDERMPFGLFDAVQGGALFGPVVDFFSAAPGVPLTFSRAWSSGLAFSQSKSADGPLGAGWSHAWLERVQLLGGDLLLFRGDGGVDRFRPDGAGGWLSPSRMKRTAHMAGAQIEVVKEDGSSWFFDPNTVGRLTRVVAPGGLAATMTYYGSGAAPCTVANGPQGQLCRMDFFCGRTMRFWYQPSPSGHGNVISRVTWGADNFDDAVVAFSYLAQGVPAHAVLASARYPTGTSVSYLYSPQQGTMFLSSVVNEDGFQAETLTYDPSGRVAKATTRMRALKPTYSTAGTRIDDTLNGGCWNIGLARDVTTGITPPSGCVFVSRGMKERGWDTALENVTFTRNQRDTITSYAWGPGAAGVVRSIANDNDHDATTLPPPADDVVVVDFTNHPVLDAHLSSCHSSVLQTGAQHCSIVDFDEVPTCAPLSSCTRPDQFNLSPGLLPRRSLDIGWTQDLDGNAHPFQHVTSYTYDSVGRTTLIDGPRNDVEDTVRLAFWPDNDPTDRCGRVSDLITNTGDVQLSQHADLYTRLGHPTAMTDSNGHTTVSSFDTRGLQTRAVGPTGESAEQKYRPSGQPLSQRLTSGAAFTYDYGPNDFISTMYRRPGVDSTLHTDKVDLAFDDTNELKRQTYTANVGGSDVVTSVMSTSYDEWRRPFSMGKHRSDPLNPSSVTQYKFAPDSIVSDMADDDHTQPNIHNNIDALGRTTSTDVDVFGRKLRLGQTSFDFHSNIRSLTDANGRVFTQVMDDDGRVLQQTSPDTGVTRFEYNEAGATVATRTADGAVTRVSYDAAGRATQTTAPGISQSVTYDAAPLPPAVDCRTHLAVAFPNTVSRVAQMRDESGTTWYGYDSNGRTLVQARLAIWETCLRVTRWTFDETGRLSSTVYPTGREVDYRYSATDPEQLSSISVAFNSTSVSVVHDIDSHAFGGAVAWTLGNGLAVTMTPWLDRELKDVSLTNGGAALEHHFIDASDRDGIGNVLRVQDLVDGRRTQSFAYDDLYRLASATVSTPPGSAYSSQLFDYTGEFTQNRQSITREGIFEQYAYVGGTNRIDAAGAQNYGYDLRGNVSSLTTPTQSVALTHDALGRLTQLGTTQYSYGVGAQRVRKGPAPFTDFYYASGPMLLAEVGPYSSLPAPLREYVYFGDRLVAVVNSTLNIDGSVTDGEILYVHSNFLGAPIVMTDAGGGVVWQASYEPFGRRVVSAASTRSLNLALPGQYVDSESRLHYNWARYYNPDTGRYLEADKGLGGHLRPYAYADLSPERLTDASGAFPVLVNNTWPGGIWTVGNAFKIASASIGASATYLGAPPRDASRWQMVGVTSLMVWSGILLVAGVLPFLVSPSMVTEATVSAANSVLMPFLEVSRLLIAGPLPLIVQPSGVLCLGSTGTCAAAFKGGSSLDGYCGAAPFLDCFMGVVNICPQTFSCDPPAASTPIAAFGRNPYLTCVFAHETGHSCGAPPGPTGGSFPEFLADDAAEAVFGTGKSTGAGCASAVPILGLGTSRPPLSPGLFAFSPP